MKPIRTRDELLDYAARFAPTKAVARIIREEGATVLGGFTAVQGLPGWIVVVKEKWQIAILVNETKRAYQILYLAEIPWETWDGHIQGRRLRDGDYPNQYALNRLHARRKPK